ncbi:MAG: hypothetical protein LHW59_08760 [Candidatus Cloacimonetes bacterium]|nr:hypothetical protein [Candidatus Cloacimonadota bacterium]
MGKFRVLVTAELIRSELERYSDLFDFVFKGYGLNYEMLDRQEFIELCKDVDIIVSEFDTIDREVIDSAEQLKLIVCCRGGVRTVVDVDYAKFKGIKVTRNRGRNRDSVSEHTLALILDLMRNITITDRLIRSPDIFELHGKMPKEYGDSLWGLDKTSPYIVYRGSSIRNTSVGIVGFGHSGRALYSKLKALGFKVLIYDHNPDGKGIQDSEYRELKELLSESDVVTLHISGNTRDGAFFGKREFEMMKPTAFFVNTSRGFLVDESDLVEALTNKTIAGAAIDVVSREPMDGSEYILNAPNLIITPHIGGSSLDTLMFGTGMAIQTLLSFKDGHNLKNEV